MHRSLLLDQVYGNRGLRSALVELHNTAVELGFTPLSARVVGEHATAVRISRWPPGRPVDADDLQKAEQFGA